MRITIPALSLLLLLSSCERATDPGALLDQATARAIVDLHLDALDGVLGMPAAGERSVEESHPCAAGGEIIVRGAVSYVGAGADRRASGRLLLAADACRIEAARSIVLEGAPIVEASVAGGGDRMELTLRGSVIWRSGDGSGHCALNIYVQSDGDLRRIEGSACHRSAGGEY